QCACEVRGHVAGAGGGGSPAVSSRESGNGGRAVSNGLSVKDLGKAYRTYRSELQRFARWFGIPVRPATENWVLRDISFSVGPGEAVAIAGQNGAGKSTLLKLIPGTTRPTEGAVHVAGSVSAMLELGMGFDPELTGRENVFASAGLMG